MAGPGGEAPRGEFRRFWLPKVPSLPGVSDTVRWDVEGAELLETMSPGDQLTFCPAGHTVSSHFSALSYTRCHRES